MALYLGSKKVAGNTTSESLDDDVKDYKVTFDDSGEVDGITDMDTFMNNFKSKLQLENLFSIIKAGFKIVKDNITNITNTISNLTASDIKATDTEGILGTENTEVISQDLIDAIADKVVNELVTNTTLTNQLANYVSKSMISTSIENNSSKVSATSLVYQLNSDLISTNSALNNKSNNGHTHDDRYYTEAEMTNLLNNKANSSHNHDERYYTESEVNNLLNNKISNNSNASLNSLELIAASPYIDFHYGNSTADYTSRIIESSSGVLNIDAGLRIRNKRVVYSENNNIAFRNESGSVMAMIDVTDVGCLVNIVGHRMNFAWNGSLQRMYVWLDGVQLGYLNILK